MSFLSFIHRHKLTVGLIIIGITVFSFGLSSDLYSETSHTNKTDKNKISVSPEKRESNYKTSIIPKNTTSGYKVFIDPETGKFVENPTDAEEEIPVSRGVGSLNVSEELVEEPAPGGGVMIVLPESHYYFSTATVDKNGKLSTGCSKHNHVKHADD